MTKAMRSFFKEKTLKIWKLIRELSTRFDLVTGYLEVDFWYFRWHFFVYSWIESNHAKLLHSSFSTLKGTRISRWWEIGTPFFQFLVAVDVVSMNVLVDLSRYLLWKSNNQACVDLYQNYGPHTNKLIFTNVSWKQMLRFKIVMES